MRVDFDAFRHGRYRASARSGQEQGDPQAAAAAVTVRIDVNPGWFADNYLLPELLAMVTQLGIFPFPLGEGKTAPVSNEDIGRVAAESLANPAPYIGKTIRPTGPKLMSPQDLVESFSRVTGRKVKYDNISEKLFLKSLQFMKIPAHFQAQVRRYVEDYRKGSFEIGAPNDVVLEMTGKPAEDFDTIVRRYIKNHDDVTRPTLVNKLKAILGFIKLVLTGAVDLDRLEIDREYPLVQDPKYAIEYAPWLQSHSEQHIENNVSAVSHILEGVARSY